MSGATSVVAIASAITAAAGTYVQYQNGQQQQAAAKKAAQQAQDNANKQASDAEQQLNAANQKTPDSSAILSAAQQSGKGGASGTMLTGSQGVDTSGLSLGKSTLLGS